MMNTLWMLLQSQPARHAYMGAIGGFFVAVRADRECFKKWNSWKDVQEFDWSVASFRYVKGAVIGAFTVGALGGFTGV